jgi:hypothetical protein
LVAWSTKFGLRTNKITKAVAEWATMFLWQGLLESSICHENNGVQNVYVGWFKENDKMKGKPKIIFLFVRMFIILSECDLEMCT